LCQSCPRHSCCHQAAADTAVAEPVARRRPDNSSSRSHSLRNIGSRLTHGTFNDIADAQFRAAVPMSLGIAGGATTLAAIIDVTSATAARLPWRTVAEFAGAGLLLLVACLVMRLRPNAPAERCLRAPIVEFGAGFCTALTNPITAGYFVAEFGGYLRGSLELTAVALAAIPVVALAACLSFSRFLMTPPMRRITEGWHRPIRLGTATVLVAVAGAMILRGV